MAKKPAKKRMTKLDKRIHNERIFITSGWWSNMSVACILAVPLGCFALLVQSQASPVKLFFSAVVFLGIYGGYWTHRKSLDCLKNIVAE